MKIRFIRGWQEMYIDGQVVDFPEGQAAELVRRGICQVVLETEDPSAPPHHSPAGPAKPEPAKQDTKGRRRTA